MSLAYDFKRPLTDIIVSHVGNPARGDVVTFKSPRDSIQLIKRVIGKAHHVLVSADILGNWLPRLERFAQAL